MLSKEDYLSYLKEMFDIETKMINVYSGLKEKANDQQMKDFFFQLAKDEISHASTVRELTGLIKQKYPEI